ncbi:hypothetical protein QRX50_19210 [Amycolatopsis carbonis]|uniref:Uncharacterized protein n=1 Tax=Amycolatopsis carbonis TaxID=715471 RepID=A0A9Y2MXV7_9PSEU|nr:hypothetical protein [Amycolatopsis sp. 2-15]WIX82751.1 hypothetical protein QRX50_19210 [Amycolatopsis sp. 2-15]
MYQRVDEQQSEAVRVAFDTKARTLEEAAALLAEAYVGCVLHIGQEYGAITAALSTSPDMAEVLHAGRERYVDLYLEALNRFVPGELGRAVLFGSSARRKHCRAKRSRAGCRGRRRSTRWGASSWPWSGTAEAARAGEARAAGQAAVAASCAIVSATRS